MSFRSAESVPQTPHSINTSPIGAPSPNIFANIAAPHDIYSSSSSPSSADDGTPDTSPTEDVDKALELQVQRRQKPTPRPRLETSAPSTFTVPQLTQPSFSPLTIDTVDPFGQVPIRITETMHQVIQTTLQIYAGTGNNYKLRHLPKHMRATINQFPIQQVVHASVFKPHHLYSLIAAISSRVAQFSSGPNPDAPRLFRANAIRYLRDEMKKNSKHSIDKHTMLDILFLCVSEMSNKEYESVRLHLNYITKLFPILDMNDHFDFWISETAAHVDNQLSLSTGKPPVLPFDFDPGPMLPERMVMLKRELHNLLAQGATPRMWLPKPTSLLISSPSAHPGIDAIADLASTLDLRMGRKFEMGLKIGIFNAPMARIVRDLIDCINIAKVVWLSPLAVCFDAEWLCRKARAVLRALLALAPERTIGPVNMVDKCMESCRMALMIAMSHACTVIGTQTAQKNVYRLQKAMAFALDVWAPYIGLTVECAGIPGSERDDRSNQQVGFVLWANMIGVWSSPEEEVERYFLTRCVNVCRLLGINTYEELNDHLSEYIYAKTLQEPSLRRVIEQVEAY